MYRLQPRQSLSGNGRGVLANPTAAGVPAPHAAPNIEPQGEVRPNDPGVIFRRHGKGVELVRARRGQIPFFEKGGVKDSKAATFNARAETVATVHSFREAFKGFAVQRNRKPTCGRRLRFSARPINPGLM